jgi:hypothetical protein
MPCPSRYSADTVAPRRPRGRPRKNALPAASAARFAPIRLAGASSGAASFACAFEVVFPDGLTLRVARHADFAELERLLALLRRPMG